MADAVRSTPSAGDTRAAAMTVRRPAIRPRRHGKGASPRPRTPPERGQLGGSKGGAEPTPRQIAMFNIAWAGSRAPNELVARRSGPWAVNISIPVH